MKGIIKTGSIAIVALIFAFSCGQKALDEAKMMADEASFSESSVVADNKRNESAPESGIATAAGSSQHDFIPTLAATTVNDGAHKFIRTADFKFKVKEVVGATAQIEQIIIQNRGFIINSSITNRSYQKNTVKISSDSSLVEDQVSLVSTLELRVPCQLLDTTLRQIAPLAQLIDYRKLNARDITVQLMSEELAKQRNAKMQNRVGKVIDNRSGKVGDAMDAEQYYQNLLLAEDNAKLAAYSLTDQIAYSNISISLYEDPIIFKNIVATPKYAEDYDSGFLYQLWYALQSGMEIFVTILLFVINCWPIILIIGAGTFIYRKIKKRLNNKKNETEV